MNTMDARVVQYRLILGDIDELIGAVIERSEIDRRFLKMHLSQDVFSILSRGNSAAIWR